MANKIQAALRIYKQHGTKAVLRAVSEKLFGTEIIKGPVTETWTEYMSWLTFVNAGMLIRGNVYCFDYAIKNLPSDAPIVEIGSFCGLTTNLITHCKERHSVKNKFITCDKWIFEGAGEGGLLGGSSNVSHDEYREFVKATFIRNIKIFSRYDLPYTIETFSDDFFEAWRNTGTCSDVLGRKIQLGGPISFCFIDGNHSYLFAKRDFENCDKHLEPGGFLLFDDSADGTEWEVCRVVKEVANTGRYELVAKNPNYFFRKK